MYEEYIDRFTQSEEMRKYLKTVKLVSWQIVEMIYYSPCPLTEKLEGFRTRVLSDGASGGFRSPLGAGKTLPYPFCSKQH